MKPSLRSFLRVTIVLSASLACNTVSNILSIATQGTTIPQEPVPIDPQLESTAEALFCPLVTDRILEAATQYYDKGLKEGASAVPEEVYLVTYSVSGDRISAPFYEEVPADLAGFQEDILGHQEIWDYFITLIPSAERGSLSEYSIVTDGEGEILAAVTQTPYDPALWGLAVDIRDADDKLNLTYTLIHEYAHLMTLGPGQVTPSEAVFNNPDDNDIYLQAVSDCPDYFPGEGCSSAGSYINAFFDAYWADIYTQWQDINLIEDDNAYYKALDDFYYQYENRFVTEYAATNPEEDIAEAFTFFVLSPRPNGETIAESKIRFFYDYPELITLRDEINNGICRLNP